jgi:hypothetical protein
MVSDMARHDSADPALRQLATMADLGRIAKSVLDYTEIHNSLLRAGASYSVDDPAAAKIGSALWSAGELVGYAYPTALADSGEDTTAEPFPTHMQTIINHYAVTSLAHRTQCGADANLNLEARLAGQVRAAARKQ